MGSVVFGGRLPGYHMLDHELAHENHWADEKLNRYGKKQQSTGGRPWMIKRFL